MGQGGVNKRNIRRDWGDKEERECTKALIVLKHQHQYVYVYGERERKFVRFVLLETGSLHIVLAILKPCSTSWP